MSNTLGGNYQIESQIGMGGMGVVYRARNLLNGESAAVKTISTRNKQQLACIRREIQTLKNLSHPGIIRILDQGEDGHEPWFAMEFISGATLGESMIPAGDCDRTAKKTRSTTGFQKKYLLFVLNTMHRVCSTLAFLHGEGIVHRDLTPSNIMIRESGYPVIMDFGLRFRTGGMTHRDFLEGMNEVMGTLFYMAPELLSGETGDTRVDIYSIGCIFYEMLTGRPVFKADSVRDLYNAQRMGRFDALSSFLEGVHPELESLFCRMLAFQPHERIGYAFEVCHCLNSLGIKGGFRETEPPFRIFLHPARFTDRKPVFRKLTELMARTSSGQGFSVLMSGESGIGKTRCLKELAHYAARNDFLVLVSECPSTESINRSRRTVQDYPPLSGMHKIWKSIADICIEKGQEFTEYLLGNSSGLLSNYESTFTRVPGFKKGSDLGNIPADQAQKRLFATISGIFARLSESAPLMIIIDDLHWADGFTLEFMKFFSSSGELKNHRIVLLGAYRIEEASKTLNEILESGKAEYFKLDSLQATDVQSMINDMLESQPVADILSTDLIKHCEGNPFFVSEYLQCSIDHSVLIKGSRGEWTVDPSKTGSLAPDAAREGSFPESLRHLVLSRFQLLSEQARSAAGIAAVLGQEIAIDILVSCLKRLELNDPRLLDELVARQILSVEVSGSYRFVHGIIHEVILDLLDPRRKNKTHGAAAYILIHDFQEYAEAHPHETAYHAEMGGEKQTAARWYLKASSRFTTQGQQSEAVRCYEKYRNLKGSYLIEDQSTRAVILKSCQLRFSNLDWVRSEYALMEIEAVENKDDLGRGLALNGLSEICINTGKFEDATRLAGDAARFFESCDYPEGQVRVLGNLGLITARQGKYQQSLDYNLKASELASKHGLMQLYGWLLSNAALNYYSLCRDEKAIGLLELAVKILRDSDWSVELGDSLVKLGLILSCQGNPHKALPYFEEAISYHRSIGFLLGEAMAMTRLAQCYRVIGPLEKARELVERALEINTDFKDLRVESESRKEYGAICILQEDLDNGLLHLSKALDIFRQLNVAPYIAGTCYQIGRILIQKNRTDEAEPLLNEAMAFARSAGDKEFQADIESLSAYLSVLKNQPEIARQHLTSVDSLAQDASDVFSRSEVLIWRGRTYAALGETDFARKIFRDAVKTSRKCNRLVHVALLLKELGRINPKK